MTENTGSKINFVKMFGSPAKYADAYVERMNTAGFISKYAKEEKAAKFVSDKPLTSEEESMFTSKVVTL